MFQVGLWLVSHSGWDESEGMAHNSVNLCLASFTGWFNFLFLLVWSVYDMSNFYIVKYIYLQCNVLINYMPLMFRRKFPFLLKGLIHTD